MLILILLLIFMLSRGCSTKNNWIAVKFDFFRSSLTSLKFKCFSGILSLRTKRSSFCFAESFACSAIFLLSKTLGK